MDKYTESTIKKHKPGLLLRLLLLYLVLSLLIVMFFIGYFFGAYKSGASTGIQIFSEIINPSEDNLKSQEIEFGMFWDVWRYVSQEYVHQPFDEKAAFYGALKGVVASIDDPYSVFLDPDETKEFDIEITGHFEGIGAEIGVRDDQLVVIAPLLGSPAESAGLKAGDAILKINDTETYNLTIDEAVALIRGDFGTSVDLLIIHKGQEETEQITIVRDTISTQSVSWEMLESKVAYIAMTGFTNDTQGQFTQAVNELLLEEPIGLVLDLRNNPGGYLGVAVEVTGEFVDDKLVVTEVFSNGDKSDHYPDGGNRLIDFPTVVLIGQGTASAAEILAGALQDHGMATLVGETTFGKGSVQDYVEFDDGSSLKVTVAEWLTPNGRSINKTGIDPDIMIEYTYEDYLAGIDLQLDKAIELLTKE
ncbi:S41 family peptidase [Patescibacteria group bacterium]|nr:S41 family peptidase [Patescibacteria group bacterium]MBU1890115.1 S41 family peptidase [Patescibacteria group bacterium]